MVTDQFIDVFTFGLECALREPSVFDLKMADSRVSAVVISCVNWNENITISGQQIVQYKDY